MIGLIPIKTHDITPLMFGVSNLAVAFALYHYRLFDIVPMVRDLLIEGMEDGIVVVDPQLRIIDYNQAAQRILDLKRNARVVILAGDNLSFLQPYFEPLFTNELPSLHLETSLNWNDSIRHYEVNTTHILDNRESISGLLIVLRDITERKIAEEKLQQLAITDPLTGLNNRRYFFELAQREFERSIRYRHTMSIIEIDVDHFKNVNDTYGHQVGDQVLSALAQRCQGCMREIDVLARYGGEELIILLPETEADAAVIVAERVRKRINSSDFDTNDGPVQVTISLGVSQLQNTPEETLDRLINRADQGLYLAKQAGRNRVRRMEINGKTHLN
jgi:diguanylate cyclase (GGDEF)-like protein/PAS domain S-box-containing protein